MHEIQSPTTHILNAAAKFNCRVPLTSVEKCQFTCCAHNDNNEITKPQILHVEDDDGYWSKFLKAQRNSSVNYIYKIKRFGSFKDPTLVKKEPTISTEAINQRLAKMSYAGGLSKPELFHLLSFVLHLVELPVHQQKLYVQHLINQKLLDMELINYLQLISRHAAAGLTASQLNELQQILEHSKAAVATTNNISYYNAEHIFLKSPNGLNPYEEEYLRSIFNSRKKLTFQQTMYLAKLVHHLQQLDDCTREKYLGFLREKQILPFNRFEYLIIFLVTRAKRIEGEKLKNLLRELQALIGPGPCEPAPQPLATETKREIRKTAIEIDYLKVDKDFRHLMKCVVPNIVRLTDFKTFLKDMMTLSEDQVVKVFNSLKSANIMTKQRFHFVEKFIRAGRLGKLDKSKRQRFIELLKNVAEGRARSAEVMMKLVLPASKGPIKEEVYSKEVKEVGEARNSSTESAKKEEEAEQRQSATAKNNKKSKKIAKSLKRKAAKKKK